MNEEFGLIMPDTAEGRAIEQLAASIAAASSNDKHRVGLAANLARVAAEAMARIMGFEFAGDFFGRLSMEMHRRRGVRSGRTGL